MRVWFGFQGTGSRVWFGGPAFKVLAPVDLVLWNWNSERMGYQGRFGRWGEIRPGDRRSCFAAVRETSCTQSLGQCLRPGPGDDNAAEQKTSTNTHSSVARLTYRARPCSPVFMFPLPSTPLPSPPLRIVSHQTEATAAFAARRRRLQ